MGSTSIGRAALALVVAALVGCSSSGGEKSPPPDPIADAGQLLADTRFASAVANALDKIVARDRRFHVDPNDDVARQGTTGMLLPGSDAASGSGEVVTSQSSVEGGYVTSSVAWRNADGGMEFYVEISPFDDVESTVLTTRYVDTSYRRGAFAGFSTSRQRIADHGLGAGWQGFTAVNVYDGGGTLTVRFYTDAEPSDELARPWANEVFESREARHDVALDGFPPLPAGQDWRSIPLPAEGLAGSLNGVAGRFSCPAGAACSLDNERLLPDWEGYHGGYDGSNVVVFTPSDGGPTVHLSGSDSRGVPAGDYLSFGNWLYVPEAPSDVEAFEAGVFAAGRDPFAVSALMALTGAATYTGKAAGIYAASAHPVTDTFHADVELTADFGTAYDLGAMSGRIFRFVLDGGEPSPLGELRLRPSAPGDASNILVTSPQGDAALPGGWVEGRTVAVDRWHGVWGGRFFGNAGAGGHPASFAGTFGATDGNHSFAGAFGAHESGR